MAKSSSSSHRKKRDKISSKVRTKKTKTKGEKHRSKKVRRRGDSFSDEDDSRSLSSDSMLSSGDDRRSRRARSRTRRDAKAKGSRKKRSRKRSYSSDSSEESPRPRTKKRKSLKKYEVKKRSRSREKPRRNARTSSVSSESRSCSTCQGGGVSGDEIESKRGRGRPENRMREGSDRNKVERSRYRSRSPSLRKNDSESDCQSQERVRGAGNGRRLRSVIAVTEEGNEGRWLGEAGQTEEITYDHDDYPSCRSNDSNDRGSKRELDSHAHVTSKVKMRVEGAKEEDELVSDAQIMHLPSSGNICDRDGGGHVEGISSSHDGTRITDHVNENKISGEIISLKDEDLETILRQKALENLKRFRGKPQKIAVTGDKEEKKQPSGAKAESVQIETPEVGEARMVVAKSSKEDISENDQTRLVEETNGSPARDSISSSEFEKESVNKNVKDETVSAKQDVACPTHQAAVSGSSKMVSTTPVVDKPNLAAPKSRSSSLKSHSILKRALVSLQPPQDRLQPPQDRLLVTESSVDNTGFGTAQSVTQSSNNDGLDISKDSGSTGPELSGEIKSDLQQDEAKDGSQFEQKTMSVMRGSEMVQVSYKVYIPKKAPALGRRQLKR